MFYDKFVWLCQMCYCGIHALLVTQEFNFPRKLFYKNVRILHFSYINKTHSFVNPSIMQFKYEPWHEKSVFGVTADSRYLDLPYLE